MVKVNRRSGTVKRLDDDDEEEEERAKRKKKEDKFSVFDFDDGDKLVEKESRKWISKYKPTETTSISPVTKFTFLRSFSCQAKTFETCSRNELVRIEDSNDGVKKRTLTSDAADISLLANSIKSSHSLGANSFSYEGQKAVKGIPRDERLKISDTVVNNQPLLVDSDNDQENENFLPISVDSDDDDGMKFRSSISSPYIERNKALVEEQLLDYDYSLLDVEKVVTLKPDIIIFREKFSTDATLTFSSRCIKVEGSTIIGMENSFIFNVPVSEIVKIESSWYKEVETARVELYLKYGDEKLAKVSEGIKLNFAICDPYWFEKQEAIESLDTIYKATWNTVRDFNKAFEGVFYPQGDPDAVSISMKDVQLLQPATFINDTIIDIYIKYLEHKIEPEKKQRFHFFNSFFFRKLANEKYPSRTFDGGAGFLRVCKWTRKVNLFEKDFLFIPVNFSLHWSLIVVCHPGEVAYYEDNEMEKPLKCPCILHMDSIKGSHRGLKNVFQSYLLEEWKERHNELSEEVFNKFLNLPFQSLELPQQENSFDCGLFLLYFVERFLEEVPANFSLHAASSEFLNKNWFLPAEASGRRGYIKNILYRILNDSVQKDPPTINDYDSPETEMERCTDEECQQTCNVRDMGSYHTPHAEKCAPIKSQEATKIRRLQYSREYKFVPRDSGCSVMEEGYENFQQLELRKRLRSPSSAVEEEGTNRKQKAFSEQALVAPSMLCEDENMEIISDTVAHKFPISLEITDDENLEPENMEITSDTAAHKFPISLEIQDDENLGPEELIASTPEEKTGENGPFSGSSDDIHFVVEEDSNDNGKSAAVKGNSMSDDHQVVNSPSKKTDVKMQPLSWIIRKRSQDKLLQLSPQAVKEPDNLRRLSWLLQTG